MENVDPEAYVRVQATSVGVFNGVAGDIHVADPNSPDPRARFPRIKAKDIKRGLLSGFITLDVDRKAFEKSEKLGDTSKAEENDLDARLAKFDVSALAELSERQRADIIAGDSIARFDDPLEAVDTGGAVLEDDGKGDPSVPSKTHTGGGNFEVTAPWLSEPIKVRGSEAAEAEVRRLTEEGPPPAE